MTNHLIPAESPSERALLRAAGRDRFIQMVKDTVDSSHSKRNYEMALNDFFDWHESAGAPELNKALIQQFRAHLQDKGLAASTINLKLSAVRKLISELADNDVIPQETATAIRRVKGVKTEGVRLGNWLDKTAAQALIDAPDVSTLKGLRDRAVLAALVGCALRREECARLTVEHVQQREGRWVIVDLTGKRGKVRSVPMPSWVKAALDDWTSAAGITTGSLWRTFRRGKDGAQVDPASSGMTSQAIWLVVTGYASELGYPTIAPHDLRRTAAKLMLKGGAKLEQISLILGHTSLDVTKKYLGVDLELTNAATDKIELSLKHRQKRLPGA
jgi:site-specific recombinase XerD